MGVRTRPPLRHGLSYTPEYRAWQTMVHRCTNPRSPAYADYGGRGITVCGRWKDSPQAFLDDMGPKPSPAHELDRRDNDAGYSPENCRWVTRPVNDRNRRSNRFLTMNSERLTLIEWARRYRVGPDTLARRLDRGWDDTRAIVTPVRGKGANGTSPRRLPKPDDKRKKLRAEDVQAIRARWANGERATPLAKAFGVSRSQVKRVALGAQWRRLIAPPMKDAS